MKICRDCLKQFDLDEFHPKSKRRCIGCYKIAKSSWDKKYRESKGEGLKKKKALYYSKNKETISRKARDRYLLNPDKVREKSLEWKHNNRGRHNANCMKRYVTKLRQTPPWSKDDEFNVFAIEEIYDLARVRSELTGVQHHVDHEIPLQGELVSGLHIWNNLQILTASENCSKRNEFNTTITRHS